MRRAYRSNLVGFLAFAVAIFLFAGTLIQFLSVHASAQSSSVRPPANAVTNAPAEPGVPRVRDKVDQMSPAEAATSLKTKGPNSVSTMWGELRAGAPATVSIPDKRAAVLVQDGGMEWLEWRAKGGPLQKYGGLALIAILALLGLFYLVRGRIRIEHGWSERTIERFKPVERFGHWLLAGSFIVLALSGLNLLFGKDYLMPLIGKEAFATIALAGKWAHNNMAWAFMLGLILVFFMWVLHNIPSRLDLQWIAKAGGLFSKGVHPPARKFNAGQKLIFWGTIILGASISLSGISLIFPGEVPMFAKTFAIINSLGYPAVMGAPLPETLTPMQELQYAQIWHTIVAFAMIFMIIAHIYIGSVGMEGAFDAMGNGQVDRNWAMEHHGLWVEEEDAKAGFRSPAE
ncbi:formate dehydrogenase subunit gamma [Rhodobacteraceae bacterium NNCM2]|nr:formate dehydrogenase subunit gamma [Coraliihabitans acroporae]